MNKEKEVYEKKVKDYITRITTPIFNKVLQEAKQNRTLVVSPNKISNYYSQYNPHNYRVYMDFKKENFHPLRPTKPTYLTEGGRLGLRNSKEWVTKEHIKGCRIIIKKTQVQIDNLNEPKKWYLIELADINKRKEQVYEIHQKKFNEAKTALKSFLDIYGGYSEFKLLRIWCEEKIQNEKKVDKLPTNMFFKTENVKKDYNEANIEYFGDPVGAANYFSNRGIEDVAPSISNSLNQLSKRFDFVGNRIIDMMVTREKVDQELMVNVRTHNKVFKKLNNLLSQTDLRKWI